jgi:predicted dehydrogenase
MKKIAIAGFGFMGMTHALSIMKIEGLRLSAIIERDISLIDKNILSGIGNINTGNIDASDLSSASRYSDFEKCLQKEDIDAVIICTHVNSHYELTKRALEYNKDVFLEKPFCLDVEKAGELVDLARVRKRIMMIGHVVRFMPPYQLLKKWIDTKEFGELKFLSMSRFCGLPGWGQWNEKDVKDLSGGALFDLAIHDIDYAFSITGLPSKIKCSYLPGEYSRHDYISAMWSFDRSDIHVKVEGGFTFHKSFPFQAGFMAQFRNASIAYSTLKGDIIQIADDTSVREVSAGNAADGYFNEMKYFADCILKGAEPELCTPESSLESVKLCYKHL